MSPENSSPTEPTQPQTVEPASATEQVPTPTTMPAAGPAPVAAIPPEPLTPQVKTAKKFSPKKLGIIIAAVLILIVGGTIGYSSLFAVSKADYTEANKTIDTMRDAYNDMSISYISTSSTETEIKNNFDKIKKDQATFNENYEKLKSLKAIKKDGELKASFAKVDAKKAKFDETLNTIAEVYDKILPSVSELNNEGITDVDSASNIITEMESTFSDLSSSLQNDVNKEFAKKMADILAKATALLPKIIEGQSDWTKYDSSAVSDFYDLSTDISNAARDWTSNVEKMVDDNDIRDEMSDLSDLVFSKTLKK